MACSMRFATQVGGIATSLGLGYKLVFENLAGPCFTPSQIGGYVVDPARGLTLLGTLLIVGALSYTGASIAGKVHDCSRRAIGGA